MKAIINLEKFIANNYPDFWISKTMLSGEGFGDLAITTGKFRTGS